MDNLPTNADLLAEVRQLIESAKLEKATHCVAYCFRRSNLMEQLA